MYHALHQLMQEVLRYSEVKCGVESVSAKIKHVLQNQTLKKVLVGLLAIVSVAAMGINFEKISNSDEVGIVYAVLASLRGWGIAQFLYVICLTCVYDYFQKSVSFQKDIAIFSCSLSLLMVVGLCYRNAVGLVLVIQDAAQIIKAGIVIVGYGAMFYCAVFLLLRWMQNLVQTGQMIVGGGKDEELHKVKAGLFIFICWLPYLIAFYPGTTTYDATTMLNQYFGYEPLTNHHPYFQTLLMGIFVQTGHYFGSASAGVFVYILIQVCAFIMVLVYMTDLLRKIGIPQKIIKTVIYIYSFLPIFPIYAISMGKNINFSIAALLLTIFMFEISISAEEFVHNPKKMVTLSIVLILLCLFRNEGIAFVIGCFPCFILMARKYWKAFGSIFIGVLLFAVLWFKWFLPFAEIPNGSIAESLSVPFMQTARSVYYYGFEMTEEEKEAIDKILEFDTLADRYLPETSDRVKEKYNDDATKEELRAYIDVYFRQFLEHPITYIDAVLNKCYGYFYPDDTGRMKFYFVSYADVPVLNEHGFNLRSKFMEFTKGMEQILEAYRNIPLLGYTTSIGFYFWCTFLAIFFVIRFKAKRLLYVFAPAMVTLFVCVISPVNAYFRYGLPVVFACPFYAAMVIYVMKKWES